MNLPVLFFLSPAAKVDGGRPSRILLQSSRKHFKLISRQVEPEYAVQKFRTNGTVIRDPLT